MSEQKCQKCGLVGGAVLSWSENGVARSSWCCPRCMSRLLDEREALLKALRSVQWAGVPAEVGHFENPACPACEESPDDGHKQDCLLAAALTKAEAP